MEKGRCWPGRGRNGRGGVGVAGRLRESGESLAGARDGAEEGDRGAIVAWSEPLAPGATTADRKRDAFADWRSDWRFVGDVAARSGAGFHTVDGDTYGG